MSYKSADVLKSWMDQYAVRLVAAHALYSDPNFDTTLVTYLVQEFGSKVAAEVGGHYDDVLLSNQHKIFKLESEKRQLRVEISQLREQLEGITAQLEQRNEALVTVPDTAGRIFRQE